jgi:hypothetical protein
MSNETQVKTEQNGALNKLKTEFGQVNLSDGNEQKKAAALSFSGGGLYIGLKLNSKTNPRTGAIEESPRITAIYGKNNYLDLPINGKWWKEFADFAMKMSVALDGVAMVSANSNGDEEYAKQLMAKFRGA